MTPELEAALGRVPDYDRFYTFEEMTARARSVAERHPSLASLETVGASTEGRPIEMVRIGDGPQRILLYALPHPNEPIGAMLVQFLLDELIGNEELRSGRSWYLLPCVDPDGTVLNEGWFTGPFTVRNYARHFYRPRSVEQVEWTFPISYKTFTFSSPIPETRALMTALERVRPHFVYSLHNAGFGGVYYYLSHDVPGAYAALHEIPRSRGLFMSLGEPEMPWAVELHPAVYKSPHVTDAYDYFEKYGPPGKDPASLLQGGAGSFDYLHSLGLEDTLTLVTELPYFQSPVIQDTSPSGLTRREVVLAGADKTEEMATALKAVLDRVEPHVDQNERFYRTVASFAKYYDTHVETVRRWAETGEGMDEPASVAQRADELYVGTFYRLLVASMLRRSLEAHLAAREEPALRESLSVLESHLDQWASEIEDNLGSSPIPVRTLVQVQYGAMLALLGSGALPSPGA
jgi:hypothetical protein